MGKRSLARTAKLTGTRRYVVGKKKDRGEANRTNRRIAKRFWKKEVE